MDIPSLQLDAVDIPRGDRNEYPNIGKFSTVEYLRREFVQLGFDARVKPPYMFASRLGKTCFAIETETSFTSRVASRLLTRKDYAREIFIQAGLTVAEGYRFRNRDKDRAFQRLKKLGEAVIKPVDGQKGKGVSVGVKPEQFETAWVAATAQTRRGVLIEKRIPGTEARYLVVDGRCVAVCRRVPPVVYGDGKKTVRQLVDNQNALRRRNPNLGHRPILVDAHRENIIRAQGFNLDSVPPDGQRVIMDLKAGISTGADSQDITEQVHLTMKAVAERVAVVIPGLDVVGVDIIAIDHSAPADQSGYAIIEANTRPGIGSHLFPVYGTPINVCRYIAESCARRMGFGFSQCEIRIEGEPDKPQEKVTADILFVGDICFGESYFDHPRVVGLRDLLAKYGYGYCLKNLAGLIEKASKVIGNLEVPLSHDRTHKLRGQKNFLAWCDPKQTSQALIDARFTGVSLSNNHMMDCGRQGLKDTIRALDLAGIQGFGGGINLRDAERPLIITLEIGSRKTDIIVFGGFEIRHKYSEIYRWYATGSAPGVNPIDPIRIRDQISDLRGSYQDPMFVFFAHWGSDYLGPTKRQTRLAEQLIEAGVDLIIGHGAHIAQKVEYVLGRVVVYGLGNFVFNSPGGFSRYGAFPCGLSAVLRLASDGSDSLRLYPMLTDNLQTGFQTCLIEKASVENAVVALGLEGRLGDVGSDEIGFHLDFPLSQTRP
ncbi:CapA family protein [Mesorhizobium sp. L2C066B000]|uniref:CapA family protein n=1 Tax=Mesorhizobium sp. L2C066B000 TaxID=1287105 RepID=UPI0004CF5D03|nr:CapA family protein [Mesorhizobium sp. L2C066B000]